MWYFEYFMDPFWGGVGVREMFSGLLGAGLSTWQNLMVRWASFAASVGSKMEDRGNASLTAWLGCNYSQGGARPHQRPMG